MTTDDPEREAALASAAVLTAAHILHTTDGKGFDVELELQVTVCDLFLAKTKKVSYDATDADGLPRLRTIRVRLDEYRDDMVVVVVGAGHDSPWPGVRPGNALVHLRVTPHPYVIMDEVLHTSDLSTTVRVTPHDFYYGGTLKWTHVDGRTLDVRYPARGRASTVASDFHGTTLVGEGLPIRRQKDGGEDDEGRGVLVMYFELGMPTLADEELDKPQARLVMRRLFEATGSCR